MKQAVLAVLTVLVFFVVVPASSAQQDCVVGHAEVAARFEADAGTTFTLEQTWSAAYAAAVNAWYGANCFPNPIIAAFDWDFDGVPEPADGSTTAAAAASIGTHDRPGWSAGVSAYTSTFCLPWVAGVNGDTNVEQCWDGCFALNGLVASSRPYLRFSADGDWSGTIEVATQGFVL